MIQRSRISVNNLNPKMGTLCFLIMNRSEEQFDIRLSRKTDGMIYNAVVSYGRQAHD